MALKKIINMTIWEVISFIVTIVTIIWFFNNLPNLIRLILNFQ
jgi:hypothetical protein